MSEAGHHQAMRASIRREQMHRIDPPASSTEKSDKPPYSTDDIFVAFAKAIFMLALAIVSVIFIAGGGAWLFTTFMNWAAPYWPVLLSAIAA